MRKKVLLTLKIFLVVLTTPIIIVALPLVIGMLIDFLGEEPEKKKPPIFSLVGAIGLVPWIVLAAHLYSKFVVGF